MLWTKLGRSFLAHSLKRFGGVYVSVKQHRSGTAEVFSWQAQDLFILPGCRAALCIVATREDKMSAAQCKRAVDAGHLCLNSMPVTLRDTLFCSCNAQFISVPSPDARQTALQHLVICHIGSVRDKRILLCKIHNQRALSLNNPTLPLADWGLYQQYMRLLLLYTCSLWPLKDTSNAGLVPLCLSLQPCCVLLTGA